jgi:hypothetical protein
MHPWVIVAVGRPAVVGPRQAVVGQSSRLAKAAPHWAGRRGEDLATVEIRRVPRKPRILKCRAAGELDPAWTFDDDVIGRQDGEAG